MSVTILDRPLLCGLKYYCVQVDLNGGVPYCMTWSLSYRSYTFFITELTLIVCFHARSIHNVRIDKRENLLILHFMDQKTDP